MQVGLIQPRMHFLCHLSGVPGWRGYPLPQSVQNSDDAKKNLKISVFAIKGEDHDTYYKHINSVLDRKPRISMDDGADLISTIHSSRKDLIDGILGGTEETTTGVIRLKIMEEKGVLNERGKPVKKILAYPIKK